MCLTMCLLWREVRQPGAMATTSPSRRDEFGSWTRCCLGLENHLAEKKGQWRGSSSRRWCGGRRPTFCTCEFHFLPPTRTLTVLSMSPADTTTPWSSRVTSFAALVNGLSMVASVDISSDKSRFDCRSQNSGGVVLKSIYSTMPVILPSISHSWPGPCVNSMYSVAFWLPYPPSNNTLSIRSVSLQGGDACRCPAYMDRCKLGTWEKWHRHKVMNYPTCITFECVYEVKACLLGR